MKKIAFVFPGQGSQSVGMLDGFSDNAVVKQALSEASEVLGFDLEKLISQGPKSDLDLTINTQPVMLAASIAIYRAWIAAGGEPPSIVAGHSLGEYAALVAAGVIEFNTALLLVRFRAQVMQEAVPVGQGGMAAILGLPDSEVCLACAEAAQAQVVEAVNFNAPSQVVIAGHRAAVERACELAKAKGAKRAVVLPVSAPFHSSLMKPASDRLADYIAALNFEVPKISLINNVDVTIEKDVGTIKNALVRQAAAPVRWVETIQKMAEHSITHVVECGPGKVLTGLTKRINDGLVAEAIADQASLENVLGLLK